MDVVELGEVPGEGNSEGNCNVVLFAAGKAVDGIIVIDVPDTEVEVVV